MIDKKSRIPLYLQLMEEIISKIESDAYNADGKLPSERELCQLYDVSRITVRQTLQELEREGYIYKLHGKGTFVATKPLNQNLINLYSFTDEMKKLGKVPSVKVLSFNRTQVDDRLASIMNLNKDEEVYKIVRIRLADEEPLLYETSHLPVYLFPDLKKDDLEKKPMYSILNEHYGVQVTRAVEQFSPIIPSSIEAEHLNTDRTIPAMLIKRYAYRRDTLIEYTKSVARGDKFEYTVELN